MFEDWSWSPDGRRVTFIASNGDTDDAYVEGAAGKGRRLLARNSLRAQWSPAGGRIALTTRIQGENGYSLATIAAQGGRPRKIGRPADEFAWDRFDERTADWYLAQLDGPSTSTEQCLRDWHDEHDGLHGSETLRTEFDRRFREQFFDWRPYLHRYPGVRADQKSKQAMIDAGAVNALGIRYVGTRV